MTSGVLPSLSPGGEIAVLAAASLLFGGALALAWISRRRAPALTELAEWAEVSRSLVNRAAILAVFVRRDGTVSFISDQLLSLTGYKAEDVIGKKWLDVFVASQDRQQVFDAFAKIWTPEFARSSEYPIITRDGSKRMIRWMRMLLHDADGAPTGVCSIGEDLTAAQTQAERIDRIQDFYERILENITSGVFVADVTGHLFYANAAMRGRSGILPHEIGDTSSAGPLPRSLAPFRPAYLAARRALHSTHFDSIKVKRHDGEERQHSGWMIPLMQDGAFDGMVCVTEDVTERNRVEQELLVNRDMLSEIVSLTSDWVWECDENARYTYASGRISKVLGYSPEEVIGMYPCDLAPPDEVASVAKVLKPLIANPRPFSGIEVVGLHREGRRVLLEVSGVPMYGSDGAFSGYRGVNTDITEREAEKRLRQRLASAIAYAQDVILILDRDGIIEYVNPVFETVTGYAREEAIGYTARQLLDSRDHPEEDHEEMWSQLASGLTWTGRFVNRRKDGGLYHADATISPMFDDDLTITGFVAVQRDVTETVELTDRLRRAIEMERFGNLVSGVAHEVRNPLNSIQAAVAALELEVGDQLDAQELFDIVRSQVARLAQLMRDLLVIGKPIDEMSLEQRRGDELIADALKLWRATHPEIDPRRIRFVADGNVELRVDPIRMQQVIINLLDNAFQHGGDETDVVVAVRSRDESCCISVCDSGKGIATEALHRVFEPFFTTHRGGTGLGLALVKSIIERHGGNVSLSSNDPLPGCTFEIILPIRQCEEVPA